MANISENIGVFLKDIGVSIRALEQTIGCSNGVIARCISKGTDISSQWVSKIIETYPQLNPTWLLLGEGNMYKDTITPAAIGDGIKKISTDNTVDTSAYPFAKVTKNTPGAVPLVSEQAVGGFSGVDFQIRDEDILGYFFIPKFRHMQVDFMIEVIGDSMVPRLWPGDIIACSIIHRLNFIQWNKLHLISSDDQGLIVKRIRKSDDDNCILAVSDNPDYDPFPIPKDEIRGFARVVGVIHLE